MKNLLSLALSLSLAAVIGPVAAAEEVDCERAITTYETTVCSGKEVDAAEVTLEQYLSEAKDRYWDEEAVLTTLDETQQAWQAYRAAHCKATHALWAGGSIRGVMANRCLRQQTLQRTWDIWDTYLTFMDSTPPLLPEPP